MSLYQGDLERRFGFDEPLVMPRRQGKTRRKLFIDFETYCDLDLRKVGLDLYSAHPSCEVLMCSWGLKGEPVQIWDATAEDMPDRLRRVLEDDDVEVHAFNAQFERVITARVLKIVVPIRRWRCTMVLAYMHSFVGDLDRVGRQMGVPDDMQKLATGKRLMKMFSMPQKPSKAQPLRRLTADTNPIEWQMYLEYCVRDNESEQQIDRWLDKPQYPIPAREWRFYALDQIINDRGMPVDMEFVEGAIKLANRRKNELMIEMMELTGLGNPNSPAQLLPWLREGGYPFHDLRKDSVKKVLAAHKAVQQGELQPGKDVLYPILTDDCVAGLKLRQQSARTSVKKYDALKLAVGEGNRIRFVFQFAGASRTGRFAGRRFQPQNLTTLRLGGDESKHVSIMQQLVEIIRAEDYEALKLYFAEPLDALAGLIRAAIRAPEGKKLVVCDLSSIESVVIGYVAKCERLLNVFRDGKDAYKDFATELYKIVYEEVTKDQRKMAKPATLGAGYRLGGGDMLDGKRTGLWGYAENMGVEMSRADAHKSVATFRRVYPEIPKTWYALEEAIMETILHKRNTQVNGVVKFRYVKPYLICELPSGRCIYYKSPKIRKRLFAWTDKEGKRQKSWKDSISYMGKQQNGSHWVRIESHGGKFIENIVQAIARDVLRECLIRLHEDGFYLIGHVHDEAISEEDVGSNRYTLDTMREVMREPIKEYKKLPLNAAGFEGLFYRKD